MIMNKQHCIVKVVDNIFNYNKPLHWGCLKNVGVLNIILISGAVCKYVQDCVRVCEVRGGIWEKTSVRHLVLNMYFLNIFQSRQNCLLQISRLIQAQNSA